MGDEDKKESDGWYATHYMMCQIVVGPQFQNITLKGCFLTCCRASENFDFYPKFFFLIMFFKPAKGEEHFL